MDEGKRLVAASFWKGLAVGGSASRCDGWGCVPSLWFGLRPNYGRGNGCNALLQNDLCLWLPGPL